MVKKTRDECIYIIRKRGETMANLAKDFTKGSIPKQLFFFMVPFMLSNALQVLYSAVDMVIVGQFVGSEGIAAVSQGSQVVMFGVMIFTGFATSGQTLIAQVLGAGKKQELNKVIGTLFSIIIILTVAFTALIVFPRHAILTLVKMPAEGFDMAMDYILICGGGLIFTAGYNVVSSILRGMGDSKRPFIFITIASVLNLVLDILFTGVLGWGVAGAAAATIIGQAVSFLCSILYLYKHKESFGFDFKLKSFKIIPNYAKTIVTMGIPLSAQLAIISISMIYVSAMVNGLGIIPAATFGAGLKIDDICIKISQGVQFAVAPMVGQNYAAKEFERTKKVVYFGWLFAGIFTAAFLIYFLPFGDSAFALFTTESQVVEMSGMFRLAIWPEFVFLAIMRGTNGLIQGVGNAKLSLVLGILDGVVFRIGFSWLFGIFLNWGFFGFVLGYGLAPFGVAVPGLIYFFSGKWKTRKALV